MHALLVVFVFISRLRLRALMGLHVMTTGSPGCPSYIELTPRMLHVCMRGCLLWMGISALPGGINCLQEESTACTYT